MASISIIFLAIFAYAPLYGLILAFREDRYINIIHNITYGKPVKFEHFKSFLTDPEFGNIMKNTLGLNILQLLINFPAPIVFAILLSELLSDKFNISCSQNSEKFAIIVNNASADFKLLSWTFVFYYFPHVLELGIPIIMMKLGLVKLKPKCVITTVIITMVSYTIIHFINVWINNYCLANNVTNSAGEIINVNYMFSITPANPLLQLFYQIIPHEYWYMYLVVPVVVIYLGAIYGIHYLVTRKRRQTV
jgi:hypothetical protein